MNVLRLWSGPALLSVCLLATGAAPAVAEPDPGVEQQVLEHINELRQRRGFKPLESDPKLQRLARAYSRDMAEKSYFSHTGPDGDNVADRVRSAGFCYRAVAENLAKNFNVDDPVRTAVNGWMQSEGHRRNILTPEFRSTGVGVWRDGATYYFTQIFLRAFAADVECPEPVRTSWLNSGTKATTTPVR